MTKILDPDRVPSLPPTPGLKPKGIPSFDGLTTELSLSDAEAWPVCTKYSCRSIALGGPLAIKELAAAYIQDTGVDDSFYIMDLGNVQRLYDAWRKAMPRVIPFYAVKCSPMMAVIELLAANGCGFDCASAAEIAMVLGAGVDPDRCLIRSVG